MNDEMDDELRRASAVQRLAMERALAPLGITPAQFAVLRIIMAMPGVSGAEAARIERLTPATLSVIVANLERKDALTRHPHPKNARVQCLQPTAAGLALATLAIERTVAARARLLAAAPAHLRGAISGWLQAVSQFDV